MAAWIQAQLTQPTPDGAGVSLTGNQRAPSAEREWVLALAALIVGQDERREVCHG